MSLAAGFMLKPLTAGLMLKSLAAGFILKSQAAAYVSSFRYRLVDPTACFITL